MCGGCGGQRATDWASPALGTTRARTAAAQTVHQLCRQAGIPVIVTTAPSGFIARWPTGRSAVTPTLTGLWSAIAEHHHLPRWHPPPPGHGAPTTPVRTPTATATLTVQPGHPPWNGTLTGDHTPIVCADEPDLDRVLLQLTVEPLRHRVRVATVTGVSWSDLPAPPVTDPEQLPVLLAWATGLQVGGHTRRRRLTVHCGASTFAVIHGHGLGLVTAAPWIVLQQRPEADGHSVAADRPGHRFPSRLQPSIGLT
jgi:hypothetical protein